MKISIKSKNITLRTITILDAEKMYLAYKNKEVNQLTGTRDQFTLGQIIMIDTILPLFKITQTK